MDPYKRVWSHGSAVVPGQMVKSIKWLQSDENRLKNISYIPWVIHAIDNA